MADHTTVDAGWKDVSGTVIERDCGGNPKRIKEDFTGKIYEKNGFGGYKEVSQASQNTSSTSNTDKK